MLCVRRKRPSPRPRKANRSSSTRSQSPTSQPLHRSAPKDLLWGTRDGRSRRRTRPRAAREGGAIQVCSERAAGEVEALGSGADEHAEAIHQDNVVRHSVIYMHNYKTNHTRIIYYIFAVWTRGDPSSVRVPLRAPPPASRRALRSASGSAAGRAPRATTCDVGANVQINGHSCTRMVLCNANGRSTYHVRVCELGDGGNDISSSAARSTIMHRSCCTRHCTHKQRVIYDPARPRLLALS